MSIIVIIITLVLGTPATAGPTPAHPGPCTALLGLVTPEHPVPTAFVRCLMAGPTHPVPIPFPRKERT